MYFCCMQFMEVVSDLEGSGSVDRVEAVCNDGGTSDYLVVYLRLLISAHLQKNAEFFSFFIEGGRTVEEFCKQVWNGITFYSTLYEPKFLSAHNRHV